MLQYGSPSWTCGPTRWNFRSKVKVTTTVNGQPGSISEIVGKYNLFLLRQQVQPLPYSSWRTSCSSSRCTTSTGGDIAAPAPQDPNTPPPPRTSLRTQWQKMVLYQQMRTSSIIGAIKKPRLMSWFTSNFIFRFDYLTPPHGWLVEVTHRTGVTLHRNKQLYGDIPSPTEWTIRSREIKYALSHIQDLTAHKLSWVLIHFIFKAVENFNTVEMFTSVVIRSSGATNGTSSITPEYYADAVLCCAWCYVT